MNSINFGRDPKEPNYSSPYTSALLTATNSFNPSDFPYEPLSVNINYTSEFIYFLQISKLQQTL
ncbi:hypothetical protein [Algoriphagus resistens]|uniref:hypothetical protein n=1 Tax=Algoriphagus resistens TaxID=1750590 RepID=UPI000ABF854D|nr:hypothetical protein [Algoriphagus resistens]